MPPMPRRRWVSWGLVVCGALALQAWALWGERWGVAANPPHGPNWPVGEIAEGITAEQTFVMSVPGLRSFTFTPRPVGPTVVGDVIFDVLDVTPEGDRPLFRIIKKATSVVKDGRPYTLEFSPIDLPVPRTFKVRIALPEATFGEGFFIDGVEHDRYAAGILVVNARQVWGDLVFQTDAPTAYLAGRVDAISRTYRALLPAAPFAVVFVVALNALLLWVAWVAVAELRGRADAADLTTGAVPRTVAAVRGWVGANRLVVAALVVLVVVVSVGLARQRDVVLVDLASRFPQAEKRTSMGSLHEGFALFDFPTVGVVEPCILALPSSRITWPVEIGPTGAMLSVRVGLRRDVWTLDGDGAVFRVGVATARGYEELRRESLDPAHYERDRRYALWRFDLTRFAGERLNVVFNTEPGLSANAVNDAALWCAPRLLAR